MKEAQVNGRPVLAGPDAPDTAVCPECGTQVWKRQRKCMDGSVTYFYRHQRRQGKDCPKRYRPM
jgi:uncharacterized protein with PIN domain